MNTIFDCFTQTGQQQFKDSIFSNRITNGVVVALTATYPQDRQRILGIEAEKLGFNSTMMHGNG